MFNVFHSQNVMVGFYGIAVFSIDFMNTLSDLSIPVFEPKSAFRRGRIFPACVPPVSLYLGCGFSEKLVMGDFP